jgi:hypothetical protein
MTTCPRRPSWFTSPLTRPSPVLHRWVPMSRDEAHVRFMPGTSLSLNATALLQAVFVTACPAAGSLRDRSGREILCRTWVVSPMRSGGGWVECLRANCDSAPTPELAAESGRVVETKTRAAAPPLTTCQESVFAPARSSSSSRSSIRRIFPVSVFGSSSTNSTRRG